MEQQRNSNKVVMALGLLFFLVILPGGSWYYLQQGLDYQKDLRAELSEYGQVPTFQLQDTKGMLQDSSLFSEKIAVVAFVTPEVLINPKQMEILSRLYDQFDKKDESRIIVYGLNWPDDKINSFKSLGEKYKMDDAEKCFFLNGENEVVQQIINQGFKTPAVNPDKTGRPFAMVSAEGKVIDNYPFFVLVNTDREIINYYDYRKEARIKTMVEHIAISIPLEKRPKPKLKREQEK